MLKNADSFGLTGFYCQTELTNNTGELTLATIGEHFLNILPKKSHFGLDI